MSFSPIAFTIPNYRDYSDWWLKAYEPGTTTPKNMALDSAGAILVAKVQLNSDGFTVSAGSAFVIPHINDAYDLWLFPTEPEADANDTSNALRFADNIQPAATVDNVGNLPANTVADMVAMDLKLNTTIETLGYYSVNDGGAASYVIVAGGTGVDDGGSYIDLDNGLQAQLIVGSMVNVRQFGVKGDDSFDDLTLLQAVSDFLGFIGGGRVYVPNGNYKMVDNFGTGVNQLGWLLRHDNLVVEFESESAVLKPNPSALQKAITIAGSTASSPTPSLRDIRILGGKIDGGNSTVGAVTNESAHGIDIRNSRNVKITGMNIFGCRGDGIYIAYGCEDIWVNGNIIDLNRTNSISGYRQGVAVLSGRDVNVSSNTIRGCLIAVDLEPDDNQISNGYNYLQRVFVDKNHIDGCDSEGVALITPLATSALTLEDVTVTNNTFKSVDETCIDVTIGTNVGKAERVVIDGNIGVGSITFKGILLDNVTNGVITNNLFPNNANIGLQLATNCQDVQIDNNVIGSTGDDACRVQESVATTRNQTIHFGGGNKFYTTSGSGLKIQGAWDVVIDGGYYEGSVNGLFTQGSTVSGNNTRAIVKLSGGKLVCTNSAGFALNINDNTLRCIVTGSWIQGDAGATYAAQTSAGTAGQAWLSSNVYTLGDTGWNTASALFNDNKGNTKVIDFP